MTYAVVTACSAADWPVCGRRMVQSFHAHWPSGVPLTLYVQDFEPDVPCDWIDLHAAVEWLRSWQQDRPVRHHGQTTRGYDFRRDAVRWSNKVAALGHAVMATVFADVLIWIDVDVITHTPVSLEWLDGLMEPGATVGWLERTRKYPETSFLMLRLPAACGAVLKMAEIWRTDAVFNEQEHHDGHVLRRLVDDLGLRTGSLSGVGREYHHAFLNSPLAARMDHLKANKHSSRTPVDLRRVPSGGGPYWKQ